MFFSSLLILALKLRIFHLLTARSKKDPLQESNEAGPVICTSTRQGGSVLCTDVSFCTAANIANIPQRKPFCK